MLSCKALRTAMVLTVLASPAAATTLVANFDAFAEGFSAPTLSDGGITFGDLNVRLPPSQPGGFSTEATDSPLFGSSFSPPNYLTTLVLLPGPGYGFGRFGAASLKFGGELADNVQMDIFTTFGPAEASQNTLTLQALLDGQVVSSSSIGFATPGSGVLH